MGRIVVTEFVSLDGVMEDPGGAEKDRYSRGGWVFKFNRGPEGDKFKSEELFAAQGQLLGRVTYQGFAAAWPNYKDEYGFADRMNNMPKYVVSSTLSDEDATWNNSTVVRGDLLSEITRLRDETDLLVAGSCKLVTFLAEHGLVDEYRLMVFPVILGEGKGLFDGVSHPVQLTLTSSTTTGDGVLLLTYEPAPAEA